ncbi:MAG TPA: hypothetical protein VMV09_01790 [Candidatus Saccharimonadales bacterium]|nr:hypothetical protein [Candidatus Saccharimonadales bacterium]
MAGRDVADEQSAYSVRAAIATTGALGAGTSPRSPADATATLQHSENERAHNRQFDGATDGKQGVASDEAPDNQGNT